MTKKVRSAPHKARVSRTKRVKRGSWIEEARKLQEQILARRGGELVPDSSDLIRKSREEDW